MMYVFLDESGDLGLNPQVHGSSRYFVLTALVCRHKRPIEKLVNKIRRGLGKKLRHVAALHATNLPAKACLRFCKKLAEKDIVLSASYLDKKKLKREHTDKHVLYNHLVASFLVRCFAQYKLQEPVVILSRRETNTLLTSRLVGKIEAEVKKYGVPEVTVLVRNPTQEKALQAADMVSWAVFQSLEYDDFRFRSALSEVLKSVHTL